ncbi:MAG: indole-3-glycerol-phosphate synthase [Bacteroidota bacterium]
MADFLTEMGATSQARADVLDPAELAARVGDPPPALGEAAFEIFAEVKRASPSEGTLARAVDPAARARAYAEAGAHAISVLTEPSRFGGSLDDLAAATASGAPVMRKDFLVDPVQLLEARVFGASGVLLIAAMLPGDRLARMVDRAAELGLFVLLEAFDAPDLERIARVLDRGAVTRVGVNCRDLRTLAVDPVRFETLAGHLPVPAIAESGLHTPDDIERVRKLGYRGALVGTALMRASDPAALMRRLACA